MNAKRITALALALVMTLLLAACGSKTVVNDDGTKTEQTERGVKVTQTVAKAVQTEKYETADFSMTIPKGWTVTTGGTNIYHSIRVYDPAEPLNQMFVLLKADILLHRRKPVLKTQYIVAIKRYYTVFIGVFPVKMLRCTAPYRLGYYQITITTSSPDHNRCLACMGLQVQVLYRALKSPGI